MPSLLPTYANITGSAKIDLAPGLGQQLQDQVTDETDEQKKKRWKLLQQQSSGITSTDSGSALGGLAAPALFGSYGR